MWYFIASSPSYTLFPEIMEHAHSGHSGLKRLILNMGVSSDTNRGTTMHFLSVAVLLTRRINNVTHISA